MTLLKEEDRGKFSSTKNAFKNTIIVLFSFLMGILLDTFNGNGNELGGFIILFFIVFIIAIIDIALRIFTYKPKIKQEKINLKESISLPAKDKSFKKVLLFCGLYRFAIGIGLVYLNVYILRYLNVNYLYYSILNIIISLSEALFGLYWARKITDRNWKRILIPILTSTLLVNNSNNSIKLTFIVSLIFFVIILIFILSKYFNNGYHKNSN